MSEIVFDARIKGEQLGLGGDEYFCDDDAILDGGSNASDGVIVVDPMGRRMLDIEIFEGGAALGRRYLSVYPLDGRDKPVEVVVEHYDGSAETIARVARFAMQMR